MAGRNEEIAIKIGAKDEASPVIEKLAKRIDGMESDEARITVTAQTDKLEAQLDRAKKKLEGLEGDEATVQARLVGTLEEDLEQANKLLEQLDGQTATVKIDSRGAKQGVDDLGKSADSSKSVLANMVGNATQDLGALGGVAGSAGVAIGQMGEYMVDAANDGDRMKDVFKNFAAVAGPIAAISAGIFLLTEGVKAFQAPSKAAAERTKELGDAMADSSDDAVAFANVLRDNTDVLSDFIAAANDPLGGFGVAVDEIGSKIPLIGGQFKEAGVDIFDASKRAGKSVFDLGNQIAGTGQTTQDFEADLQAAADAGKITDDEMRAVAEAMRLYGDAAAQAATDQGLFNVNAAEANAIFQSTLDPLNTFAGSFKTIRDDMHDGAIEAEATAAAINLIREATGLTTEEILAMAEATDRTTTSHQRTKDAITDNSAALDRHRDALDKARQKTDDLRLANEKLRGDLDRDEAYLRLQDTFQETEDAGIEAWLAVSAGAADADQVVRAYKLQQIDAKRALDDFITRFGEIPPAKQIEINTLIDEGNFAAAKTEIDKLTEAQVVDVRFNVIRPRSIGVGSAGGGGVPLAAGTMSGIPTGAQIAKQIGPVRIPADVYVRSTPRITGIRD